MRFAFGVIPAIGLQPAFDQHEPALLEVLRDKVAQLAPGIHREPVGGFMFFAFNGFPRAVDGEADGGVLGAFGGEARLGVATQMSDKLHPIE